MTNIFDDEIVNSYSFECQRCKGVGFTARINGNIECMNCGLTYGFIQMKKQWVLIKMDVEKYIEEFLHKGYDEEKKEYVPKDLLRERLKLRKEKEKEKLKLESTENVDLAKKFLKKLGEQKFGEQKPTKKKIDKEDNKRKN